MMAIVELITARGPQGDRMNLQITYRQVLMCSLFMLITLCGCGSRRRGRVRRRTMVELTYWPAPNPQKYSLLIHRKRMESPASRYPRQDAAHSRKSIYRRGLACRDRGKTTPDVCSIFGRSIGRVYAIGRIGSARSISDFDSAITSRTPRSNSSLRIQPVISFKCRGRQIR